MVPVLRPRPLPPQPRPLFLPAWRLPLRRAQPSRQPRNCPRLGNKSGLRPRSDRVGRYVGRRCAPRQTAGAVPLAGPDAAAGLTATAQASALTACACHVLHPCRDGLAAGVSCHRARRGSLLHRVPSRCSLGRPRLHPPAQPRQPPCSGAAAASAAPTGAAAGAAPGLPSALGASSVTNAAAASGPARNGDGRHRRRAVRARTGHSRHSRHRCRRHSRHRGSHIGSGALRPPDGLPSRRRGPTPHRRRPLRTAEPRLRRQHPPSRPRPQQPCPSRLPSRRPSRHAQSASQPAPQTSAPLQPQLAKPLFTLVGAPHGQHIMTLKVSPEDLGPLTVRAQIDAAGVRIELFAPGEAGREAVRGILPELRRELHDAGFGASLDLSDHSGPRASARTGDRTGPARHGPGPGRRWWPVGRRP